MRRGPSDEARSAYKLAEQSAARAERDRAEATRRRREAERLAAKVRAHNVANRYDDWLRQVVQGL